MISELDGSNAVLRRFVYGPGDDEPLVWYEGSGTTDRRWLHADERGSVIAMSDSTGATISSNSYDEYGIPESTNNGRFQYTGQAWIPELQMYYYKARIYSPTLGRFLQTDPSGYSDGLNIYAYVHDNPINTRDPLGLGENGVCDGAPSGCGTITITAGGTITVSGSDWWDPIPSYSFDTGFTMAEPMAQAMIPWDNSACAHDPQACIAAAAKDFKPQREKRSVSDCLIDSGKKNGAALVLDSASVAVNFVPGGTAAKFTAGLALGMISMSTSIGGMNPTRQGLNGASIGAGISGMLASAAGPAEIAFPGSGAVAAAKFFGKALGITSLAIDGYQAYLDYKECRNNN